MIMMIIMIITTLTLKFISAQAAIFSSYEYFRELSPYRFHQLIEDAPHYNCQYEPEEVRTCKRKQEGLHEIQPRMLDVVDKTGDKLYLKSG
jgi:hypothetical protein